MSFHIEKLETDTIPTFDVRQSIFLYSKFPSHSLNF